MFHTRAVVLSIRPYREYDELISFFMERFGKRIVLARGSRRATSKLAATIHSLTVMQCSFVEGKRYPILTSTDHAHSHNQAPEDFYARYFLYALLALCDDILYEGDRNEKLWNTLSGAFQAASATERKEKKDWIDIYDKWLQSFLVSLGVGNATGGEGAEVAARQAFADTFYRNPYPLEPFAFQSEADQPRAESSIS